jgi:gametolysin peptidase M11
MIRRALVLAALVLGVGASSAPALVNDGDLHILVILATWGPEPYSRDFTQQALTATDKFVRENSYGKARLTVEVTPWVKAFPSPPRCGTPAEQDALAAAAKSAAAKAGSDPGKYTRFVYVFPALGTCGYTGWGSLHEVFINGAPSATLVEHELGHTFGLQHAHTLDCSRGTCEFVEYGDDYDTMGSGAGDYNAYEKNVAGWLTNVTRVRRNGKYRIEAFERRTATPEALVVQTARNEYWFDHRAPILGDAGFAGTDIVKGLEVHAGPPSSNPDATSDYNTANTLIPDPSGQGGPTLLPGDSFTERGAFRLTVLDQVGTHVDAKFEWLDRTPPARVTLDAPATVVRSASVHVQWEPGADAGSGVDHYVVSLDARRRQVRADFTLPTAWTFAPVSPGRHIVSVVAVDRAGNRGKPARRVVSVR